MYKLRDVAHIGRFATVFTASMGAAMAAFGMVAGVVQVGAGIVQGDPEMTNGGVMTTLASTAVAALSSGVAVGLLGNGKRTLKLK